MMFMSLPHIAEMMGKKEKRMLMESKYIGLRM